MKKLILLFFVLALCACAKKAPVPSPGEEALASRWQAMQSQAQDAEKGPWRTQISLRFGDEGNTRRVTAILWGNNDKKLRLDVMAGVGALVAKILEDGDHFLVYSVQENRAYFHDGPNKPLFKVGVPVPFDLAQLAELLNGNYPAVFGERYAKASNGPDGNAAYVLSAKIGGDLELDNRGLPVVWNGGPQSWQMRIDYDDGTPPLPRKLTLARPDGKRAIVLVKERENSLPQFTKNQMDLSLPSGVRMLPLSEFKPS